MTPALSTVTPHGGSLRRRAYRKISLCYVLTIDRIVHYVNGADSVRTDSSRRSSFKDPASGSRETLLLRHQNLSSRPYLLDLGLCRLLTGQPARS